MAHVRRDSRSHARISLRLPVRVTDPTKRVAGGIGYETAEISPGGAFLPSQVLLELGELLCLDFTLPNGRHVCAHARVVRTTLGSNDEPSGIGVEFVEITPDDRAAIEHQLT
jgi:Tfp pilus assembly protein PilZ